MFILADFLNLIYFKLRLKITKKSFTDNQEGLFKINRYLYIENQHKLCFIAKSTRPTLFFISNLIKTESL